MKNCGHRGTIVRNTRDRIATRKPSGFLFFVLGLLAALAVAAPATATPDGADLSTAPWIASDKPDYAPGETVTLDGGNWQPGESVRINVDDDQTKTWERNVTVVADGSGRIADSFNLPDWFVATFQVVATGELSGVARTSFTDANLRFLTDVAGGGSPVSFSAGWTRHGGTGCTGSPTSSGSGLVTNVDSQSGTLNVGADAQQSVRVTAPATIDGRPFVSWTSSSGGTINNTTDGGRTVCAQGDNSSNVRTFTANYGPAPTTVNTATSASSASATYGDASVTLSASVTPASGPAVSGGTVSFTVKKGATTVGTVTSGTVSSGSASASFPLAGVDADAYTIEASYSGSSSFDPSNNSAQTPSPTLTVNQKIVAGSFSAANKAYDGNVSATITGRSLSGVVGSDDVTLSGGTATFATKNVGNGKTVTGTGFALSGAKAANYSLVSSTLTTSANITARDLAVSATGQNKVYDGTTAATVTLSTDAVSGDTVNAAYTSASFVSKHVGTGKTVNVSGISISGADAANYDLTDTTATTTADVTARPITVAAVADSKEYDGTTSSSATPEITVGAIAPGDTAGFTQAFDTKHAGTGKTLTPSGAVGDGNDGDNYAVTFAANNDGVILAKGLTGSFTAADKVYDGNATASITGRSLNGKVNGDDVSLTGGTASFNNKHVGQDKPVSGSGFALAGDDAGNYTLGSVANTTASIAALGITGSFTAADKVYDGNANASITGRFLQGVLNDDVVSLAGGTASFDDKNVGQDKPVGGSGFTLEGADAGNYAISSIGGTTANITPRDLTVSAAGMNRQYDGTTNATVTLSTNKLNGDAVTADYTSASFTDKSVGTGKTVNIGGISISGADAGNYNLTNSTATTTANITPRSVTGSFTAADKFHDGTTAATITGRSLVNTIDGDAVSLSGGTATFANAAVGANKTVTGTGFGLSGSDAGNYMLASSTLTTTASILAWNAQGHGFYQPVGIANSVFVAAGSGLPAANGQTVYNVVKGGSTIPLKFNVYAGTVEKTSLSDIGGFSAVKLATCTAGATMDDVDFVTTGSTSLRYDTADGQWIQNWKTPSVSGDTCYRASVTFADGSSLSAFFRLRK